MKATLFAIFWLACSLYSWGTLMACSDYEDAHRFADQHLTSRDEVGLVAPVAVTGPIGAIASIIISNFNQHGWELWQASRPVKPCETP
jgi:hypothetical protein